MTGIEGALPPEGGVMLRLCLQSLIGIPPADDERTQVQRNADGVMELCKRQLDSGTLPTIGGRRPHLMVIVHEETLAGTPGAAQLEGAGAISVRGVVPAGFARRREGDSPLKRSTPSG